MNKKIILLIILVVAIVIGGFFYVNRPKDDPNILTLFGNIEIRQVDLSFRVEGKIAKMLFEEGDAVKKGQLLANLDNTTYQATYEKNMADIAMNKSINANAKTKYERNIPLCRDGTTSKVDCDDMLSAVNTSKASIDASTAQSRLSKKNLEDSKLYAPEDGIIMTRVQEPGAIVEPSQAVYTMAKSKPIWVRAYIPETNLANVKYGMKAKVLTDTINPKTGKPREYTGWVGYISPVAEFTPKTVQTTDLRTDLVYRVRVYVYEIDEYLRQGMPVTIKLDLSSKETRKSAT